MDEKEILKLAKTIKPVVKMKIKDKEGNYVETLSYIQPTDLWKSYLKEPTAVCKAPEFTIIAQVVTRHASVFTSNYVSGFNPSSEEVLDYLSKNLPPEILEKAVAFETKYSGNTFNNQFQISQTNVYGLVDGEKVPEQIKNQKVIYHNQEYDPKDL